MVGWYDPSADKQVQKMHEYMYVCGHISTLQEKSNFLQLKFAIGIESILCSFSIKNNK